MSPLETGSLYPKFHSWTMRTFGPRLHPLKDFASWIRPMAHRSLDSPIRVTIFHSGDQFSMRGKQPPFLCLIPIWHPYLFVPLFLFHHGTEFNTTIQPCSLLRFRRHENGSFASHARLWVQTWESGRSTSFQLQLRKVAKPILDHSNTKEDGQCRREKRLEYWM